MKKTLALKLSVFTAATALAFSAAAQTFLYWNNDGLDGASSGTWDLATPTWSTDANPSASPVVWDGTSAAVFAVTNSVSTNWGNFTITVDSAVNFGGIYNNGTNNSSACTNVLFVGNGSLNIPSGNVVIVAGNGSIGGGSGNNNIFRIPITGDGAVTFQANVGSEYLSASNSYSGGTTIDTGNGINFNTNSPFGSGPITVSPGRTQIVWATPDSLPLNFGGGTFANGAINIPNNFVASTVASTIIFVGSVNAPTTFSGNWNMGSTAQKLDFRNGTVTAPATISGVISGSGLLAKAGNGVLVLSGSNTYSGKTVITNGVLSVSSINKVSGGEASSSLGHPTTAANGTIDLGFGTATGVLLYTGAGETTDRVLNLSGTTGGGAITNDGSGALVFTANLTATGSGAKTLTLSGTNTGPNTISGKIVNSASGATSINKASSGTWILSGANAHSGNTTINGGVLGLGSATALGSGTLVIGAASSFDNVSGGDLTITNALTVSAGATFAGSTNLTITGPTTISGANRTITVTTNTLTLDGVVGESGSRKLTKAGAGTLALMKANTFTGGFQINAGILKMGNNSVFGTGLLTLSGGTVQSDSDTARTITNTVTLAGGTTVSGTGAMTFTNTFTLSGGNRTLTVNNAADTTILGGIIDDGTPRNFTKAGTGTLILDGVSTYAGNTIVNNGILTLGGSAQLGGGNYSGAVTINGGTLNFASSAAQTLAGVVSGGGPLNKSGEGTLTLSATNTHTGTITISTGTLIAQTNCVASTNVIVASGATLQLDSDTALSATTDLWLANGTPTVNLNFTGTNQIHLLSLDGGATIAASGIYGALGSGAPIENSRLTGSGFLSVQSPAVLSTTNIVLSTVNNGDGSFSLNFQGTPGADYYVEFTPSLNDPVVWTIVPGSTNTADINGLWSATVTNLPPAFYRGVAINPAP